MNLHLTTGRMAELAVAVLLLAAGIYLYRRRDPAAEGYGNQGAVILLVIAVIMAIHALGGLAYRPSKAEAEYLTGRGR
jgi:hypothetical protein